MVPKKWWLRVRLEDSQNSPSDVHPSDAQYPKLGYVVWSAIVYTASAASGTPSRAACESTGWIQRLPAIPTI